MFVSWLGSFHILLVCEEAYIHLMTVGCSMESRRKSPHFLTWWGLIWIIPPNLATIAAFHTPLHQAEKRSWSRQIPKFSRYWTKILTGLCREMSRLLGNNTVLAIATRKDAVILVFRSQQGKALNDWMWKTTCVELCDVILPRPQLAYLHGCCNVSHSHLVFSWSGESGLPKPMCRIFISRNR